MYLHKNYLINWTDQGFSSKLHYSLFYYFFKQANTFYAAFLVPAQT